MDRSHLANVRQIQATIATMTKVNITVATDPETPTTGKDTQTYKLQLLSKPNVAYTYEQALREKKVMDDIPM